MAELFFKKMSMSKNIYLCVDEFKSEASVAEEMLDRVVCSRERFSSVFRCALKVVIVVMVAELFVTGPQSSIPCID